MSSFRNAVMSFVAVAALAVFTAPTFAGGDRTKLEYVLSGAPINNVTPSGKAVIDQPNLPGQLTCEVKDVNLPDGTVLVVRVNFYVAGTLTLSRQQAKTQASIPFQVGPGPFEILQGDKVIMTGRFKI
jgi:hypothetical protein